VKEKYNQNEDYNYICEQLKSIRQDLTVQSLKNDFTVEVYETHARLSLKYKDITEYNQCQTQLISLYDEGFEGCKFEFTAYHILYLIYSNEIIDLTKLLLTLSDEMKSHRFIKYTLSIYNAWSMNNYYKIFRNKDENQPKSSRDLFNIFAPKYRIEVLKIITKGFRPSLPLDYLQTELNFNTKKEMMEFLKEKNVVFLNHESLDCKLTYQEIIKL
jgi:hypothetical protein